MELAQVRMRRGRYMCLLPCLSFCPCSSHTEVGAATQLILVKSS